MGSRLGGNGLRVVVGLVVALLVPAASAAGASATFTGRTSQGNKCDGRCEIVIKVHNNVVERPGSSVEWFARCNHGFAPDTEETSFRGRLTNGKYYVHEKYAESGDLGRSPDGPWNLHFNVTIAFKLQHGKATGTLNAKEWQYGGPHLYSVCSSGNVTFTAGR